MTAWVVSVREPRSLVDHRFRFDDPDDAYECANRAADAGLEVRVQEVAPRCRSLDTRPAAPASR